MTNATRQRARDRKSVLARECHPSQNSVSVNEFLEEQVLFLTDCNRLGTAMNYRRAASSLSGFLQGRELSFPEMDAAFVERYKDWLLRRGLVRNSISFHMRILRAVYNKAVRYGYAGQTFPFRDVYTGIDRTRKRAVGEAVVARLIRLDLTDDPSLSFVRDLFLFSVYTRGMAFVDIAYLRKTDLQDGCIRYARRKTGRPLSVRVEPCIRTLIDRYSSGTDGRPWLFPILDGDDPAACYRRYKSKLRAYNRRLKDLSWKLGPDVALSSYTSRHTWAMMARNHDVPISVISAGMGHSSERTTQIYLDSLEDSLVDKANRGILEALAGIGS